MKVMALHVVFHTQQHMHVDRLGHAFHRSPAHRPHIASRVNQRETVGRETNPAWLSQGHHAAGEMNRMTVYASAYGSIDRFGVQCHLSRMQANTNSQALIGTFECGLHGKRGLAGQNGVPFKHAGYAKHSHDAVAQRSHHGAAETFNRTAHALHRRTQPLHGLLRVQTSYVLGGVDNVCKQNGCLLEPAPPVFWNGCRHAAPKRGTTIATETVYVRVDGPARRTTQRHLFFELSTTGSYTNAIHCATPITKQGFGVSALD